MLKPKGFQTWWFILWLPIWSKMLRGIGLSVSSKINTKAFLYLNLSWVWPRNLKKSHAELKMEKYIQYNSSTLIQDDKKNNESLGLSRSSSRKCFLHTKVLNWKIWLENISISRFVTLDSSLSFLQKNILHVLNIILSIFWNNSQIFFSTFTYASNSAIRTSNHLTKKVFLSKACHKSHVFA